MTRFFLDVRSGPASGRTLALRPGQVAQVGRSGWANLSLADPALDDLHFLIEVSQAECQLRDLGSSGGTFLNGQRVTRAAVGDGDVIRAGGTEFLLRAATPEEAAIDGAPGGPPPQDEDLVPASMAPESPAYSRRGLREVLEARCPHLYAILDAARDPLIYALLLQAQERYQSLYEGPQGDELALFAPYLVALPAGTPLLDRLIGEGWGQSWGIFLACDQPFEAVRKHFRRFLLVRTEDGKELYFRYYDPRVMRRFPPTCTPAELREFFGPVTEYLVEGDSPAEVLVFRRDEPGGRAVVVPIAEGVAAAAPGPGGRP